jgi:hypothetical protein
MMQQQDDNEEKFTVVGYTCWYQVEKYELRVYNPVLRDATLDNNGGGQCNNKMIMMMTVKVICFLYSVFSFFGDIDTSVKYIALV